MILLAQGRSFSDDCKKRGHTSETGKTMHPDTLEPGLGSEAVKLRVFSSPLLIRKADDESDNEHDNLYHEQNFRNNPRRDDYPEFKRVC